MFNGLYNVWMTMCHGGYIIYNILKKEHRWKISFRRTLTKGEKVIRHHQLKEELADVTLSADQGDDD
jgi:hypothetical protein